MIRFSDQVVIVTGAGRGLGRLFALELARRGARVVVNDLGGTMHGDGSDSSVAQQVVDEIRALGQQAVASHDSVATPEGAQAIVNTALQHYGRVDAVISNAGIFNSIAFDDLTPEDWRRMLGVHLDGGFYLSQAAFCVMKAQGYGRFVFISSSAGVFGQPMEAHRSRSHRQRASVPRRARAARGAGAGHVEASTPALRITSGAAPRPSAGR